jgi:hypothetical protein
MPVNDPLFPRCQLRLRPSIAVSGDRVAYEFVCLWCAEMPFVKETDVHPLTELCYRHHRRRVEGKAIDRRTDSD